MFASIEHGPTLDDRVMVAGYVVMRLGLLCLWWLVSRQDVVRAPAARSYMVTIGVAQAGWIALAVASPSVSVTLVGFAVLLAVELTGPWVAERKAHTPWHPHHIAERYGLLVIITLGEVILGTVASVNALVQGEAGWSVDAALVTIAGVGMAFGCWWMYFAVPWAAPLVRHRERAFTFGYGHLVIFGALAAIGAGLHVAALELEGRAKVGALGAILTVAVALGAYGTMFYVLYSLLMRARDSLHLALGAATLGLLALSVALAAIGVSMAVCLLVLALVPAVTVVGYETLGHRHVSDALRRL
jgi:low temperature requirement protein LtrA